MRRKITLMLSALLLAGCSETREEKPAPPPPPLIYKREIVADYRNGSDDTYGERLVRFTNTETGKSVLILYRGTYNSQSTVVLPSDF